MCLLAVQGVGLEPFFPFRNPVGPGRGNHAVPPRHQVGHDGLTCQRGRSQTVRFECRASHNRAGDARLSRIGRTNPRNRRNRTGIERGDRVYRSRQAVHQRLIEHVVSHLPSRIARAAGIVKEDDIEMPKTLLVVDVDRPNSATAILLTVEREIVLEHKHGEFRWWKWIGLHQHSDGVEDANSSSTSASARGYDWGATHPMAAGAWIRGIRHTINAIGRKVCVGKRVARISRQD